MAESTTQYDKIEQDKWQKQHDELKSKVDNAKGPYVNAKEQASKALNELNNKEAEVNKWQSTLNELVKQGASEEEIKGAKQNRDAAQAQVKGLQNTYKEAANNERIAKKEYNNKKSELEQLEKSEPKKIAEEKQKAEEKAAKQEAKKQQQNANAKAKIKSMLSKIADPSQNIHKTVCLKAGILPSTPYAIKFCEWLQDHTVIDENGECDWYTIDDNNNTSIDGKVLKVYKKDWILERANAKEKEKQEAKEKKDKEKQEVKEKADKEKAVKWWSSTIKKWRQDYLDNMHKKYGSDKIKVIPDEVSTDEMQLIGEYAANNPTMTNNMSWSQLSKGSNKETIDTICKRIWNNQNQILSIKNEMSDEAKQLVKEKGQEMTPDAAIACFTGGMSNTFALAKQGLEIAHDPDILLQKAMVLENASMAAVSKLTNRATIEVANSMKSILDLTPITSIPMDAAKEMLKLIPTPADIMKKLDDAMKLDEKMEESSNNALNEELNNAKNLINEKASSISKSTKDKLKAFNDVTAGILNVMNQGPDWYIDNLNTVERKFECEMVKGIQDATLTVLDYKFQFRDALVAQVAYNLVAPVAEVLEKAQIAVLRKIVELKNKAIAKAKALAAKAIMKILGLLGA